MVIQSKLILPVQRVLGTPNNARCINVANNTTENSVAPFDNGVYLQKLSASGHMLHNILISFKAPNHTMENMCAELRFVLYN
jgi:hypothetical protein